MHDTQLQFLRNSDQVMLNVNMSCNTGRVEQLCAFNTGVNWCIQPNLHKNCLLQTIYTDNYHIGLNVKYT